MTTLLKKLVKPSPLITDLVERDKASLLSVLLLWRLVALVMVGVIVGSFAQGSPSEMRRAFAHVVAAVLVDLAAYLVSRTRFFRIAAWIVILESMAGVTLGVLGGPSDVSVASTAAWLILGTLIGSLVLPPRQTIFAIALTFASLMLMSFHVSDEMKMAFGNVFLLTMVTSVLALAGTVQRDRTERRLTAERGKVIQASKLSALGEMAGGIAHEINTPLAIIKLNAELMEETLRDRVIDKQAFIDQLQAIVRVVDRTSSIIKGLKTLSRNTAGEPPANVDVRALIDQTLTFCTEKFRVNGVSLRVEAPPAGLRVRGIETQLSQVLLNLLNNAYDSVLSSPEKWITVETRDDGATVEIRVTDGGPGVPRAIRERIFEPFFTTKQVGQGTGLGLSVSKSIMDQHGGALTLDASSPHASFVMKLPRAKALAS